MNRGVYREHQWKYWTLFWIIIFLLTPPIIVSFWFPRTHPIVCDTPLSVDCIPEKDNQEVSLSDLVCENNSTYGDMLALSLNASNSGTGTYLILANAEMEQFEGVPTAESHIIINVNGVDMLDTERMMILDSSLPGVLSTQLLISNVTNGQTIKVGWRTNDLTGCSSFRSLIIHQV